MLLRLGYGLMSGIVGRLRRIMLRRLRHSLMSGMVRRLRRMMLLRPSDLHRGLVPDG
ncbi:MULTISPECIES: hypothetical protein [Actinoplanes]|uniref:hypothetical protein n=1 Tax=Actinoplanes TaxID=1865 RepID=UPI000B242055|nr:MULTISPECIES: hypothetical protein [Actinoplanes]